MAGPRSTVMAIKLQSQKSADETNNAAVKPGVMRRAVEPSHQEIKASIPQDHRHLLSLLKF